LIEKKQKISLFSLSFFQTTQFKYTPKNQK